MSRLSPPFDLVVGSNLTYCPEQAKSSFGGSNLVLNLPFDQSVTFSYFNFIGASNSTYYYHPTPSHLKGFIQQALETLS